MPPRCQCRCTNDRARTQAPNWPVTGTPAQPQPWPPQDSHRIARPHRSQPTAQVGPYQPSPAHGSHAAHNPAQPRDPNLTKSPSPPAPRSQAQPALSAKGTAQPSPTDRGPQPRIGPTQPSLVRGCHKPVPGAPQPIPASTLNPQSKAPSRARTSPDLLQTSPQLPAHNPGSNQTKPGPQPTPCSPSYLALLAHDPAQNLQPRVLVLQGHHAHA